MGVASSSAASDLSDQEIDSLRASANAALSRSEIRRLYNRFQMLDRDRSGSLSIDKLYAIPELAMNPLSGRIVALFDCNGSTEIDLTRFVQVLARFTKSAPRDHKISFAFRVYDVNNDNFICQHDLFFILNLLVGKNLSDTQIRSLVQKTIAEADVIDKDGKISLEEFKRLMWTVEIGNVLSIEF